MKLAHFTLHPSLHPSLLILHPSLFILHPFKKKFRILSTQPTFSVYIEKGGKMQNDLFKRLLKFGAAIIQVSETLGQNIEIKAIRSQLTRSATSVGANYQESQSASSRADFINKIQIALKELRETLYWLHLLQKVYGERIENENTITVLIDESEQLIKILNSCVLTAKQNQKRRMNNEG